MQTLREIMTKNVEIVRPNATLFEAAEKMRNQNVGVLPVVEGKKIEGMITDRDIVIRALANRKDPRQTRVSDLMTRDVVYSYEDQGVDEAAKMMHDKHVRRILVLNNNRNLVGVISLGDLATQTGRRRMVSEVLEEVSTSGQNMMVIRRFWNNLNSRVGMASLIGVATLIFGVFMFRRRPELRARLQGVTIPFEKDERAA